MEQKNKDAKNNNSKKKKFKTIKRYALCFPFHIDSISHTTRNFNTS